MIICWRPRRAAGIIIIHRPRVRHHRRHILAFICIAIGAGTSGIILPPLLAPSAPVAPMVPSEFHYYPPEWGAEIAPELRAVKEVPEPSSLLLLLSAVLVFLWRVK